ncbi:MAG: hypothetical protein MJH10_20330 [Epibacterium sp.]|nr:hypothetical protein [Epibacterium sp.]NQX75818.1 hypothetical protein [Epibacterium sp.]
MKSLWLTLFASLALFPLAAPVAAGAKVKIDCDTYDKAPVGKTYSTKFVGIIGQNGAKSALRDVCNCILEKHDLPAIKRRDLSVTLAYEQVFNVTHARFTCTSEGAVSK